MATTQNTVALVKAQDLQVAISSGTSFAMAHKMGLAQINMKSATSGSVVETITYSANSTSTAYGNTTTTSYYPALNYFTGNIPYNHSNTVSYFIAKPKTQYLFSTPYKNAAGTAQWTIANGTNSTQGIANTDITTGGVVKSLNTTVPAFKNIARLYSCTKGDQTYTVAITCTHKLECWGADGGLAAASIRAGAGGYTYGTKSLNASTVLHIGVGGEGTWSKDENLRKNSWNGGGPSDKWGSGGGGCTHIATAAGSTGQLKELSSNTSSVLMVAGGGGGNDNGNDQATANINKEFGAGGGTTGGDGCLREDQASAPKGGGTNGIGGNNVFLTTFSTNSADYTQTTPGFGQGGSGCNKSGEADWGGGGGGGWYGGAGAMKAGFGGGGSGYLHSSLTGATMRGDVGANKIPLPTASSGYKAGKYVATMSGSTYVTNASHNGNARITCMPYD